MVKRCNDFYKVTIKGVVTVIRHSYTRVTSVYYYIDGTEVDDSVLEDISDQLIDDNKLNEGIAYNATLNKVEWTESPTTDLPDRKIIVMKMGDMLVAEDAEGVQYNLVMLNRWGVADFGSSSIPFNMTASKRPTVQLPGESGDEAHEVAFIEDVPDIPQNVTGMVGAMDLSEAMANTSYAQVLPILEESYITDLGKPVRIDGKPYDETTNNYTIGNPYFVMGWLDDTLTMHYELFSKNYQGLGYILQGVLGAFNLIEKRVASLENPAS